MDVAKFLVVMAEVAPLLPMMNHGNFGVLCFTCVMLGAMKYSASVAIAYIEANACSYNHDTKAEHEPKTRSERHKKNRHG